jgi:hypothetical protein
MNTGKTLFAQIMDFLPWKTFHRIVARHGGDKGVRQCNFFSVKVCRRFHWDDEISLSS